MTLKEIIIISVIVIITTGVGILITKSYYSSNQETLIQRLADTETQVRRQKEDSITIASKYGTVVTSQKKLFNELSNVKGLYQQIFKEKSSVEKELKKSKEHIAALVTINRSLSLERDSLKAVFVEDRYEKQYSDKWVDLDLNFNPKLITFGFKLKVRDEMKLVLAGQEAGYLRVIGISSNPYMSEQQTFKLSYDPEMFISTPKPSYFPWGLATDAGLVITGWFIHSILK